MFSILSVPYVLLFLLPGIIAESHFVPCLSGYNLFTSGRFEEVREENKKPEDCGPILLTSIIESFRNSTVQSVFTDSIPDHLCQIIQELSQFYEKEVITHKCESYVNPLLLKAIRLNIKVDEEERRLVEEDELVEDGARNTSSRPSFIRITRAQLEYSFEYLNHFLTSNNVTNFIILNIYDAFNKNNSGPHLNPDFHSLLRSLSTWDPRKMSGLILVPSTLILSESKSSDLVSYLRTFSTRTLVVINLSSPSSNLLGFLESLSSKIIPFSRNIIALDFSSLDNTYSSQSFDQIRKESNCFLMIKADAHKVQMANEQLVPFWSKLRTASKLRDNYGKEFRIENSGKVEGHMKVLLFNGSEFTKLEAQGTNFSQIDRLYKVCSSRYVALDQIHFDHRPIEDLSGIERATEFLQVLSNSLLAPVGIALAVFAIVLAAARKRMYEKKILSKIVLSENELETSSVSTSDAWRRSNSNLKKLNGKVIYLKKLNARSVVLKPRISSHLCKMYELRHENLNGFLGLMNSGTDLALKQPHAVWEFCNHGSLYDVIEGETIPMDWTFKLSLLLDLARGMKYLHESEIEVHGRLTSKNCLIDSRWLLKITDFGIQNLYHLLGERPEKRPMENLLWSAPELLRRSTGNTCIIGTKASDIYSFSMVMSEIVMSESLMKVFSRSASDQIEDIIDRLQNPYPILCRPRITSEDLPDSSLALLKKCWSENSEERPSFTFIYDSLRKSNDGRSQRTHNIVDDMFHKLEKYSNTLEEMVKERTDLLDEERKKTDALLMRMLPTSVAGSLKAGLDVLPEKFDDVTVFFSDIVGFTSISSNSSPLEIVGLLNQLYSLFDGAIARHQVYKVETIGDAYMVVGGVPERIPDHAEQIVTMAIDLIDICCSYEIPHMPNVPLLLRVGVNTGPVVAGVVGHTMPRYCLFGDTVNVASRMESSGKPFRIHISSSTYEKLRQSGKFSITYRGEMDIKGKGKLATYWVTEKLGYAKKLPELDEKFSDHGLGNDDVFIKRQSESEDVNCIA